MTSAHRRRQSSPAGPSPDTPYTEIFLTIGRITAPHGLRGEVKMAISTDRPEHIVDLNHVYLDSPAISASADLTKVQLSSARVHPSGRQAVLKFTHITERNSAENLRGTLVKIRGDQLPPPEEDALFHYQILGLTVFTEKGKELGPISEIIESGEVDVYVIKDAEGREHLFPALKEVVLDIDPVAARAIVRPQQWES